MGLALRLARIDADIAYPAWYGYITDEGRWVAHARELALFGEVVNRDWLMHLVLAPLFQGMSYVVFALAGVTVASTRLPTAMAGAALLVVFWAALRRTVPPHVLLIATALLAFQPDLVVLSRLAVPEVPVMFLELLAYVLVVSDRLSVGRFVSVGALLLCAIAMKATSVFTVVILSIIAFRRAGDVADTGRRLRLRLAIAAGLLAPALPLAVIAGWWAAPGLRAVAANLVLLPHFLGLSHLYSIASFPFEGELSPAIMPLTLGVWLSILGSVVSARSAPGTSLFRYARTAILWSALYVPIMLGLQYFPDRYKLHLLLPLAIAMATGLAFLEERGAAVADAWLPAVPGCQRWLATTLLGLPSGVLFAPAVALVEGAAHGDPSRLRAKVAAVVICWLLATLTAGRLAGRAPLRFLVLFPLVGTAIWMIAHPAGLVAFWSTAWPEGWVFVGLPASIVAATVLAAMTPRVNPSAWRYAAVTLVALYAGTAIIPLAPSLLTPTYSLRDASRDLGTLLASEPAPVGVSRAETLFSENRLAYRSVLGGRWPSARPSVMVIAFRFRDTDHVLDREYELISSYPIRVSRSPGDAAGAFEMVHVYRRRIPDGRGRGRAEVDQGPASARRARSARDTVLSSSTVMTRSANNAPP